MQGGPAARWRARSSGVTACSLATASCTPCSAAAAFWVVGKWGRTDVGSAVKSGEREVQAAVPSRFGQQIRMAAPSDHACSPADGPRSALFRRSSKLRRSSEADRS